MKTWLVNARRAQGWCVRGLGTISALGALGVVLAVAADGDPAHGGSALQGMPVPESVTSLERARASESGRALARAPAPESARAREGSSALERVQAPESELALQGVPALQRVPALESPAGAAERAPGEFQAGLASSLQSAASGAFDQGEQRLAPYPPARWRWVHHRQLDRVLLWPSHVLIQYDGVDVRQSYFSHAAGSSEPPVHRSRAQALALARQVSSEAREHPERFGSLARQYSDDRATRDQGGSLGPLLASDLRQWPELLDAMAALRPGQASEVLETEHGFHVFSRREPPAERVLGGSHIVIGYDEATWLGELVQRKPVPPRTRGEALELANGIYRQLEATPARFAEFAERYSEFRDGAPGGDFGAWSTREYGSLRRQREQLERLSVGGIAPPLETIFGFEIIQRTERPRERYAAAVLQLRYDSKVIDPSDPRSEHATWQRMRELARLVAAEPARFDELRANHCCKAAKTWTDGQDSTSLALAVPRLRIGELASEPIAYNHSVVLVRRLDPAPVWKAPPAMATELPSPATPDLTYLWSRTPSRVLSDQLARVAERSAQAFALLPGERAQLFELSRLPALPAQPEAPQQQEAPQLVSARPAPSQPLPSQPASSRRATIAKLRSDLEAWLGPERYPRYLALWAELYESAPARSAAPSREPLSPAALSPAAPSPAALSSAALPPAPLQ